MLFKKSKIYIKTFKPLLHVSITRSSSGSIYCSSLKLYFKTFSELLCYVLNYNFSKGQYMLPEDDRVIETCSSVLNVLM